MDFRASVSKRFKTSSDITDHAWDIPAKTHQGVLDWHGVPATMDPTVYFTPPSLMTTAPWPVMDVIDETGTASATTEATIPRPNVVTSSPTASSSKKRSHSSVVEKEEEETSSSSQEEEIEPEEEVEPADDDNDTVYYHPVRNKLDIVMSGSKLVNDIEVRGNNRLRISLNILTSKLLAVKEDEEPDDFEQSRVAMELVNTIQQHWKAHIYTTTTDTPSVGNSRIILKEKITDEDDAYEAILGLVEQQQKKDSLDSLFQDWKKHHEALERKYQDKKASPKGAATTTTTAESKKRVRFHLDRDDSSDSNQEGNEQESDTSNSTQEDRPEDGKDGLQEKDKTNSKLKSKKSFLPPGLDQKELDQLRQAAVVSLKSKQQRDLAFGRRDYTRAALLASQHQQRMAAAAEKKEKQKKQEEDDEETPITSPTEAPTVPAWRELSALEALCSMVHTDHSSEKQDDTKTVGLEGSNTKKRRVSVSPPPPTQEGEDSQDEEVISSLKPAPQYRNVATGSRPKPEEAWNIMFQRLCNYKEEYGDCLVPYSWEHDRKLGDWVSVQRKRKKKNILPQDRVKRLDEIGFVWALRQQEPWDSMYERLLEFKREHGHLVVPQGYKPYPKLGRWVVDQRNHMRRGRLPKDRAVKLESIGFVSKAWLQKSEAREQQQKELERQQKQQQLNKDKTEESRSSTSSSPKSVRDVQQEEQQEEGQKEEKAKGHQDQGDHEGSDRDCEDDEDKLWDDDMFERLQEYKEENGNCWVPERYKPDRSLGKWVSTIRSSKEELSRKQIQKLESVGFVFSFIQQLPWDNMVENLNQARRQRMATH